MNTSYDSASFLISQVHFLFFSSTVIGIELSKEYSSVIAFVASSVIFTLKVAIKPEYLSSIDVFWKDIDKSVKVSKEKRLYWEYKLNESIENNVVSPEYNFISLIEFVLHTFRKDVTLFL